MKIIVEKEDIIHGLQKAVNIIPQKTGTAFLRSLWIIAIGKKVSFLGTDSNIEFKGVYSANVEHEGIVGVQARAFVDLMRLMDEGKISLFLDADKNVLHIEQGKKKYKVPVNDPAWFQEFVQFPVENSVLWSGEIFKEILERVIFCISDDDSADAIACMYIKPNVNENGDEYVDICGLNGHQFALVTIVNEDLFKLLPNEGILLQKKYLVELKKWLEDDEFELNISDKRFFLQSFSGETFSLPRVTYNYPDYFSFIGKLSQSKNTLTLNKRDCIDSLNRVIIFNTKKQKFTNFSLSEKELLLFVQGQEIGSGSENLEVTYSGNIDTISFPSKELIDCLSHFRSNILNLHFSNDEGPCFIKGQDDLDYLVIIMPMKISTTPSYSEEEV